MLVLSRAQKQAVIVDGRILVIARRLFRNAIELSIEADDKSTVLVLRQGESTNLDRDIRVTLLGFLEMEEERKVRLGIEAPREVPVHRKEVWDALHGR